MSTFVHLRGEGVKNSQNFVQVVIQCPLVFHLTKRARPPLPLEILVCVQMRSTGPDTCKFSEALRQGSLSI